MRQHRDTHADWHESLRSWLFHSQTYFDHAVPTLVAQAREFSDLIQQTFAETDHVEISAIVSAPVGPHPRGSFEVLFTREVFVDYVTWLMFMRPQGLDLLVHPLSIQIHLSKYEVDGRYKIDLSFNSIDLERNSSECAPFVTPVQPCAVQRVFALRE